VVLLRVVALPTPAFTAGSLSHLPFVLLPPVSPLRIGHTPPVCRLGDEGALPVSQSSAAPAAAGVPCGHKAKLRAATFSETSSNLWRGRKDPRSAVQRTTTRVCVDVVFHSNSQQNIMASLARTTRTFLRTRRPVLAAQFSDDSHDDFKPQKKVAVDLSDAKAVQALLAQQVKENPVIVYMKGTPDRPQCGFSQQTVRVLHAMDVEFASVNVLEHPEIRDGIKVRLKRRQQIRSLVLWKSVAPTITSSSHRRSSHLRYNDTCARSVVCFVCRSSRTGPPFRSCTWRGSSWVAATSSPHSTSRASSRSCCRITSSSLRGAEGTGV